MEAIGRAPAKSPDGRMVRAAGNRSATALSAGALA